MSQENVERHRRAIEAYNAHDVDAFIALCDPSIEAHSVFARSAVPSTTGTTPTSWNRATSRSCSRPTMCAWSHSARAACE